MAAKKAKKPASKTSKPKPQAATTVTEVGEETYQISAAASELIPTGEYANVTVGPVMASHTVSATDTDELHEKLTAICEVVELVVSEQRELVLESLRDKGDD